MVFIVESIKLLFSKKENNSNILLDDKQKKKYRKQFISIFLKSTFLTVVSILSIGQSIIFLFTRNEIVWIAIAVLIGEYFIKNIIANNEEIKLVQERIHKRHMKNLKQQEKI